MRLKFPQLRFSLRIFFVGVAVLSVGLAWLAREWHIVRERKAVMQLVGAHGNIVHVLGEWKADPRTWIRKLLDDPVVFGVLIPDTMPELCERFKRAFPESTAGVYTPEKPEPEVAFFSTIRYIGPGQPAPALAKISADLNEFGWLLPTADLNQRSDQSLEAAAVEFVRNEFQKALDHARAEGKFDRAQWLINIEFDQPGNWK